MLKEVFLEKAHKMHGDTYDYSNVPNEFRAVDKIPIICKEHGVFYQAARNHTNQKHGCPVCGAMKRTQNIRSSFEEFNEKSKKVHKGKIVPIKDGFVAASQKVKFKCKTCGGTFEQTGSLHLSGYGCPICNPPHKKRTTEDFVEEMSRTHPNLEILGEYVNTNTKIKVRCKIHDYTYETTPHRLVQGANCQKCYDERRHLIRVREANDVMENILKIHQDKYVFPKFNEEYKNSRSKVTAICKQGHTFKIAVNKLLSGQGCRKCSDIENGLKKRLTYEQLIERIKRIHKDRYKYPYLKEEFKTTESIITIVCPKHGEFKTGIDNHIYSKTGCPLCNESHLERDISNIFTEASRYYKPKWLGRQNFDFFLPEHNVAIECQGLQHFKACEGFGEEEGFEKCLERDFRKNRLAKENNIKIIYVANKCYEKFLNNEQLEGLYDETNLFYIEDILEDVEKFKQNIYKIN